MPEKEPSGLYAVNSAAYGACPAPPFFSPTPPAD
jgi:hypothetical protein